MTKNIKNPIFDHPQHLSFLHSKAAMFSALLENYKVAVFHSDIALEFAIEAHNEKHPVSIMRYDEKGHVHRTYAQHKKALECYQKALALSKKVYGKENFNTVERHMSVGVTYLSLKKPAIALKHFKRALAINQLYLNKKRYPQRPYLKTSMIETHAQIARTYTMQKKFRQAFDHERMAHQLRLSLKHRID